MTTLLWIAVALLTANTVFMLSHVIARLRGAPSLPWIPEITPLVVTAGVLVALITMLLNLRRNRSEDVLEAATDLFEKAHESLVNKDGELLNHRLSWLSAARLIATAERLARELTETSHKSIYQTKRDYWRTRLYDLLHQSMPEGPSAEFFAEKPEHMIAHSDDVRAPLSEKSIAFLYRFCSWPKNAPDPISDVANFSDEEIQRMQAFGPRSLGRLLEKVRNISPSRK
jgi:hypothetical protein